MRKKKRSLRPAFVVTACTASAIAAGIACSSSSNDIPPPGGSSGVVNPPEQLGCPPEKPQEGTPCTDNGLSCSYGGSAVFGCPDPVTSGNVDCVTGLWQAVGSDASCAAPGPGCPPAASANGFACPADASTGICTYPDCTGGDAGVVYSCVGGHLKPAGDVPACDGGADAADASDASDAGTD